MDLNKWIMKVSRDIKGNYAEMSHCKKSQMFCKQINGAGLTSDLTLRLTYE